MDRFGSIAEKFCESGCIVDEVHGWRVAQRVCQIATASGWEGSYKLHEWQSDYSDSEWLELVEGADEAVEWLSEQMCAEGYAICWHDGAIYCMTDAEWESLYE